MQLRRIKLKRTKSVSFLGYPVVSLSFLDYCNYYIPMLFSLHYISEKSMLFM